MGSMALLARAVAGILRAERLCRQADRLCPADPPLRGRSELP